MGCEENMRINGLRDRLSISDEDYEKLRHERMFTIRRDLFWKLALSRTGQLGHGSDSTAVARRRHATRLLGRAVGSTAMADSDLSTARADSDIVRAETAISVENTFVEVIAAPTQPADPEPLPDDAFEITSLRVADSTDTKIGEAAVRECTWCGALIRDRQRPMKTHLQFHKALSGVAR
jgi:hypothetical protein